MRRPRPTASPRSSSRWRGRVSSVQVISRRIVGRQAERQAPAVRAFGRAPATDAAGGAPRGAGEAPSGRGALTFEAFIRQVNPSLLDYEHVPRLVRVGQRVADGELSRVLVFLPPRHYKSETFSRLLPAYYLHRHPERHVGLACYGAALAWELSDDARAYYQEA